MATSTNHLVVTLKKLAVPAAIAGAFVLGAAFYTGHGNVHAAPAMPLDDHSVSALSSLDEAMEAVASKVTPAVVNVAVTSRGPSEEQMSDEDGQMQQLPPGLRQFFGHGFSQMPQQPQPYPQYPPAQPYPQPQPPAGYAPSMDVRAPIP